MYMYDVQFELEFVSCVLWRGVKVSIFPGKITGIFEDLPPSKFTMREYEKLSRAKVTVK